jgi:hypothetical protein
MPIVALSESAAALLRSRPDRPVEVTPGNLDAHRELAAAG